MIKADVLIVGGGPAGAACAWQLARGGANPLIVEKAAYPRIKTCAGWVTSDVLQMLDPLIADYPYGITHYSHFDVTIRSFKFGLSTNQFSIRRIEFDSWLVHQSGAPIYQHKVQSIMKTADGFVIDGEYFGKYLVGAGGTNCPVYHQLFKDSSNRSEAKQIIAQEEEFYYPHHESKCRLWFLTDHLPGYAWYVPKVKDIVNVGVGGNVHKLKTTGDTLKRHWHMLVERLEGMGLVTGHEYQPGAHSYYLRQRETCVQREHAYLIGDSAGLSTVDMGEGISPAIHSGILAANAILHESDYRVDSIGRYSFPSLLGLR